MRSSSAFLLAALAGSSLALPWNVAVNPTGSSQQPSGTNPPPPPPSSLPPTNNGSVSTTTQTITTTVFVPTSSPVALPGGTTVYSTWLTTEIRTLTTCYPVPAAPTPPVATPAPQPPVNAPTPAPGIAPPAAAPSCPAPSTVTVTVTPPGYYTSGPGAPTACARCKTITYTDIYGYVETIIIPAPTSTPQPPSSGNSTVPQGTGSASASIKPVLPTGWAHPKLGGS